MEGVNFVFTFRGHFRPPPPTAKENRLFLRQNVKNSQNALKKLFLLKPFSVFSV